MKNKFLTVSIPVILLVIASFYLAFQFINPSPKRVITIATGSIHGQYYQTAIKYKELLHKVDVEVNIVTSSGSLENIKFLNEKKVDIAFIQNGTIKANTTKSIEALASVYYEPLWLFYKKDLNDIQYIQDLKSKKISLGLEHSGTKDLSSEVLAINGINKDNAQLEYFNAKESKDKLLNDELDALFLVTSANSKIIKELLENKDIAVFSFKRAIAYSKKFHYLEPINLYEGTVDIYNNMPSRDIKLLSTTATLVVNKDFSDELIRIFLKKVKEVHKRKSLFEAENQFPNINNIEIDMNEEAFRYFTYGDTFLEKIFPYWIASNLDRLKILLIPLLTLMIPLFKGVFPLYRWSIRSKIYRWYDEVQDLDLSLEGLSKEELVEKLKELEKLKQEIKEETKVPLSYMGEYYDLIMHLELIISKVNIKISSN
ncbi:TAXI family TRAP transporter solute-binding subunit [Poseidonibacter lekithochrous]|uniref:TAXI family TRAP transporter solute-binding subunit n=1 Tax=Poseidonibacter lekithochrous TaxID=1904463 RepID=UPI0008FC76B8|nr:TAXI family TRAP transporter solute-binding subunit [Poseidonibacter lekithochrous]QKJ21822.1 TRAP transporter, substrate binding protein, TAXI family [Poseidonibacter lekithochrous]